MMPLLNLLIKFLIFVMLVFIQIILFNIFYVFLAKLFGCLSTIFCNIICGVYIVGVGFAFFFPLTCVSCRIFLSVWLVL